jgi:hypothetical protein
MLVELHIVILVKSLKMFRSPFEPLHFLLSLLQLLNRSQLCHEVLNLHPINILWVNLLMRFALF